MPVNVNPEASGVTKKDIYGPLYKTVTFDAQAGTGAVGAVPLYTVTGEIEVLRLVPFCSTSVAGSGTLALGVTGDDDLFLAATTGTDIDAGKFWLDTDPAEVGGKAIPAALKDIAVTADIIGTVGSNTLTGGVVRFTLYWRPLSPDGNVVAS